MPGPPNWVGQLARTPTKMARTLRIVTATARSHSRSFQLSVLGRRLAELDDDMLGA